MERTLVLPLAPKEWAVLAADFPMTEESWARMIAILDTMKPALVYPPAEPSARDVG